MDGKTSISPRANTLNPTRRFAVRLSLAAGATVATLLGAQALAFRERSIADPSAKVVPTTDSTSKIKIQATAIPSNTPVAPTLLPAAPQLVVIRHVGTIPQASVQTTSRASGGGGTAPKQIAPPQPALAAPVPVMAAQPDQPQPAPVVQSAPAQPAPATSSSH